MKVVSAPGYSGMVPVGSDRVQGTPRTSTKTPYCRRGSGRATRTPEEVAASIEEELRRLELWRKGRQQ